MKLNEYAQYDAMGLKELIDKGEILASELHDIATTAIDTLNPKLNFMVSLSPDDAQQALATSRPHAAFAGIPFLVKGGAGMAGQPASPGSRMGAGFVAQEDSELVRRIKATGVVILGSTSTPEICNSFTTEPVVGGPTRNPWHTEHSVGGSSGGSSAAVAAGVVPMAQSGDGAGSIRVPAHCCGVFGLAPSRGRNPVGPGWHGGVLGILRMHVTTRTVRDSAAMLDQLSAPELGSLHHALPPASSFLEAVGANPGSLRIAFSTQSPSDHSVHPECIAAVNHTVALCDELGHQVSETTLNSAFNYDPEHFLKIFYDYWAFEYASGIAGLAEASGQSISSETLEQHNVMMWHHLKSLTPMILSERVMELYRLGISIERFFEHWDVLITPVCLTPAPPLGQFADKPDNNHLGQSLFEQMLHEFAPFTAIFNIGGQPSVSIPLFQSSEGLPIGVLCTARVGNEATLIRLAAQLEQACPWISRHPATSLFNA